VHTHQILTFLNFQKSISDQKIHAQQIFMVTKKSGEPGCASCGPGPACRVEAVLSVDDRGQMVLPKDVRERAGIQTGEKLALISCEKDGKVCCLSLIRAGDLSGMVKGILGPLFGEQE
jgi:antitoxin PrlF